MKLSADYRALALDALRGRWKTAVLAGLIASLLGANIVSSSDRVISNMSRNTNGDTSGFAGLFSTGSGGVLAVLVICILAWAVFTVIVSGAARLGITIVRTALADGRERHAAWVEQADVVLADVPCSGLGIIRKKPDIRWKDPAALAALPAIQRAILGNAAAYVRPGGVLVYSTCTVLPEENGGVVTDFLSGHPEFVKEDFDLPGIGSCSGDATLWPQRMRTDGFYICRMRRRA